MVIDVVLVDDHALIRGGLRRALERHEGVSIVGEAASLREARAVLNKTRPDVAVVDIRLPDGSGLDLCREIKESRWAGAVVILSMYGDADRLLAARDCGASAFVSKDAPAREVIESIRRAYANPRAFDAEGLAEAVAAETSRRAILTGREREVLMLLADGMSVADIARQLVITESTTKTHIGNIYAKLDAHNRAQALMTAIRLGLIKDESPLDRPPS
jgi:DNA-binding NarL/FixJ family response regulator